jgi:general secretion pathway protein D
MTGDHIQNLNQAFKSMNQYHKNCLRLLLAFACLWLYSSVTGQAQNANQRRTTTGNRSTGSTGSGSSGSSMRDYPNSTMLGDAMITSDSESKKIIVITDEETNLHISQVISNMDRPRSQVLIKVVFLEVTHNDGLDIGIEGKWKKDITGSTTGTASSLFGVGAETTGGFYRVVNDNFEITLRALAEKGLTEVLSRPSILARNNQQATITVGKEVPFITNSRITDQGQTINTVEYQDIGIILRVTPFISSDGHVEMIIAPEISTLTDETVTISQNVNARVIAKRSADTVVVTPNGKTVVIGGLMENTKTQKDQKIPILGDIPLLGQAFKRKVKAMSKTELLIFLTPYIINSDDTLAAMSNDESGKSELAPKAFSDKDLNKFLDGLPLKPSPTSNVDEDRTMTDKPDSQPTPDRYNKSHR